MHVLVTGATGYIGGRLVPRLLEAGHTVRVFARTPRKLQDVPWHDDVEIAEGDLSDARAVRAALEGIDAVYYLAHA
ncbi:SDR family NAD(P)-dependent oxidoreductase, partial [Xanthomonas citri pv. citri]